VSLPIAHGGDPGDAEHAAGQWVEHHQGKHRVWERPEVTAYLLMACAHDALSDGQGDEAYRHRREAHRLLTEAGWPPLAANVELDCMSPQAARDAEDLFRVHAADIARTVAEHPSLPPVEPAMRRK
jgi:hypothetical protein